MKVGYQFVKQVPADEWKLKPVSVYCGPAFVHTGPFIKQIEDSAEDCYLFITADGKVASLPFNAVVLAEKDRIHVWLEEDPTYHFRVAELEKANAEQ